MSKKLNVKRVASLKKPGLHCDGGNLYLQIGAKGSKSWAFRYMLDGRARQAGLGPCSLIGLAEARDLAFEMRRQLLRGQDPLELRRAAKATVRTPTFEACATEFLKDNSGQWRNPKHREQWTSTLETYAYPILGRTPVAMVDTEGVLKCLKKIWQTKPETAGRVQQRICRILDWAAASGLRSRENPAQWKGHLDKLLPARAKVRKPVHLAALPWVDMPAFMAELLRNEFISARALGFLILTAARTSEGLKAQWHEVSDDYLWTVPEDRMKPGVDHVVPLSRQAIALLGGLPRLVGNPHIFPGVRAGKPLSGSACLELLRGMRPGLTVHGFRSTFRDWAYENTDHPREIVEACLSHQLRDKAEAAYRRGLAIEKRRLVIQNWADYCCGG
jgi:integrase